jgi:acetyl-CoA carboxylase carboxyltransferase component
MGPQGVVEIIGRHDIEQAADPEARRMELVAEYTALHANPYLAAERGYVDDVIDPSDTRPMLVKSLAMLRCKDQHQPRRKHGNVPL